MRVDGDTLRTWTITDEGTERVQLSIRSAGRPVEAKVELWQSPSFIPVTFTYCFDSGSDSPLHTIIETPGLRKTIAVYNTECGHCPFEASVAHTGLGAAYEAVAHHQPELVAPGVPARAVNFLHVCVGSPNPGDEPTAETAVVYFWAPGRVLPPGLTVKLDR